MHLSLSKQNLVLLGLLLVEIASLAGSYSHGPWLSAIRIALVMGCLGLVIDDHRRSWNKSASNPTPVTPATESDDLAVLYHEIRNCTSTLKGNALLLKQQLRSEAERAPVERIERVAASIERIAREVLLQADPERVEATEAVDMGVLLRECAEENFPGRSGAYRIEGTGGLPAIQADAGKLRQAFANLFRNSLEAQATRVLVRAYRSAGSLKLVVADDGTGCAPGDLQKIFLPLHTTKRDKGGMGIGLAYVKAIVEGHGGFIWAAPRQDADNPRGLEIHISLPLTQAASIGSRATARAEVMAA